MPDWSQPVWQEVTGHGPAGDAYRGRDRSDRDVAQSGSARGWGPRGRRFEPGRPDVKLYVLVIGDRHADPTPFPFTDRDRAIGEAREWLAGHMHPDDADDLGEYPATAPWLFRATYSHEGDWVGVIVRELDGSVVM